MSEGRKRKPPVLTLHGGLAPPVEATDSPDAGSGITLDSSAEIDSLSKAVGDEQLSEEQKENMSIFLAEKSKVLGHGELKEHDCSRLADLGFGNGGVVLKMEHKPSGIIMARKMIMLEIKPAVRNHIMRELKVLHDCNSPYIVGFYGMFCVNNEISILMQHMDGGSLDLILNAGRIPVEMISLITNAVLEGLKYLRYAHGIIHRDVKPSNILVNSRGEINLCDFGVSGQLINSMANSFVGTRSYMAPERLQGEEYSILSDLWSLGVSLIEMALGRYPIPQPPLAEVAEEMQQPPAGTLPPRPGGNPYASHANAIRMPIFELLQIIFTSDPPSLPPEYFKKNFIEFVELCMQKETKKRGDMKTLRSHVFLKEAAKVSTGEFAEWVQRTIEANNFYDAAAATQ